MSAYDIGYEAGKAAASWVADGNTSKETAREILSLIEECEFDIPSPLSGEWAGESIPELSDRYDIDLTDDETASEFESGYYSGYEDEVARSARYLLGFVSSYVSHTGKTIEVWDVESRDDIPGDFLVVSEVGHLEIVRTF